MLKFLKYFFMLIFVLVLSVIGGVFYLYKTFNPEDYKGQIEKLASDALGRKVSINGQIGLMISLIPTVEINDVEISNPEWASSPYFLKVKKAEVRFEIMPLFDKKIAIDKIMVLSPEVKLEVAKDGKQNWVFENEKTLDSGLEIKENDAKKENIVTANREVKEGAEKENTEVLTEAAGFSLGSFLLNKAEISGGFVEYYDAKTKEKHTVKINNITSDYIDENSDLGLSFDIVYQQYNLSGHFGTGTLNSIITMQPNQPINADIKVNKSSLVFNGTVSELSEKAVIKGKTNIYNPAGGFDLPETTLIAEIEANTSKAKANISTLNIATNLIVGKIDADWSGKVPYINADLRSKLINLESLNKKTSALSALPALINSANAAENNQEFLSQKIDYSLLNMLNGKFNVKIDKLVADKDFDIDGIKGQATLKSGELNINPLTFVFADGTVDLIAKADASRKNIELNLSTKNLLLQEVIDDAKVDNEKDFGFLSGGNTDISANITTNGETYGDLLKNMNGQFITIVGTSKIQSGELHILTSNFVSQLLQSLKLFKSPEAKTTLNCAVIRADIKKGVASFPKGIAVDTKKFTIISGGDINLYSQKIDLSLKPSSRNIANTNISQAISSLIKIQGTLDNPKIALDDAGAVKTLVGIVTTGPVMFGSQMLLEGDDAPCNTALKGTAFASRFPAATGVKSTSKKVYSNTSDAVSAGINAVTGTAGGIIKGTAGGIMNMLGSNKKDKKNDN